MIRLLFAVLTLAIAAFVIAPARAEVREVETIIVTPMEKLPSYGSLVSAWYKQKVYDANEKKVGVISDMLFSPDGGINAVMLDVGGFLGIGAKHVAVPVNSISLTEKKNKSWLTINTTKDVLKKAAGYKYDAKAHGWQPM